MEHGAAAGISLPAHTHGQSPEPQLLLRETAHSVRDFSKTKKEQTPLTSAMEVMFYLRHIRLMHLK